MEDQLEKSDHLRRKAEERLSQIEASELSLSDADVQALIHELHVHQIELELQNEELRQAKAEAEDALRRYSDLYNFAPVGYLTIDDSRLILEANLTAGDLLGVARSSLIKAPFRLFVSPGSQSTFDACSRTATQTGRKQSCELVLIRDRKEPFHALIDIAAATEDDGEPPHWRVTIADISARKLAEEALQKAHDEMEMRVEERTRELAESMQALRESKEHKIEFYRRTILAATDGKLMVTESVMFKVEDKGPGIGAMSIPDVALTRGYSTVGTLGMGYKMMISAADRVYLATGPDGTTVACELKTG